MTLEANHKVCTEKQDGHKHIYIGTEHVSQPHELETVQVFYCITCNSTWKEA